MAPDKRKRRRRRLSDEEARLWQAAMRQTRPLATSRAPRRDVEEDSKGQGAGLGKPASPGAELSRPAPAKATSPGNAPPPSRKPESTNARAAQSSASAPKRDAVPPPVFAPFERRHARKLARGSEHIDARLDLHGMRQNEAHHALRAFITRCQRDGHRYVLIITGKGERIPSSDWYGSERGEPGVLRRMVPLWLAEPDMRALVVAVSPAHRRHGGAGAFYVRLRRPE